ncbi:MAG: DnaJ domain-containing protein, partial [Myxococcota bacterium]
MQIGSGEKHAQKVRLASAFDPSALELSPAEGFLLSRIDGSTTWGELRQMGALSADEVDRCLSGWLKDGVIEIGEGEAPKPEPTAEASSEEVPPKADPAPERESESSKDKEPPTEATRVLSNAAVSDVPDLDESLDIDTEFQQELVDFAGGLDRPYHEILGVEIDADARAMKKAYFQLSKRFHPDRYFRRNTGAFEPVIEVCFKRMLEAYELLSDPATRAEVQREVVTAPPEPVKPVGLGAKKPMSSLEASRRLRQRSGQLSGHRRVINDRKRKAKTFFESGMSSFRNERWLEAAGSVRLAIAFDPDNQAYRESFADVQRRAHEERAKVLLKQANGAYE